MNRSAIALGRQKVNRKTKLEVDLTQVEKQIFIVFINMTPSLLSPNGGFIPRTVVRDSDCDLGAYV